MSLAEHIDNLKVDDPYEADISGMSSDEGEAYTLPPSPTPIPSTVSDDYKPHLRHASSAGGERTVDEDWVTLPWYGKYHKLTMEDRVKVGVGMSLSQKIMWRKISKAAWDQGIFPDSFFGDDQVLKPDVNNYNLWFLLHEFTRKTYLGDLHHGVEVEWLYAPHIGPRTWQLKVSFRCEFDEDQIYFTNWRCNTLLQATQQVQDRETANEDVKGNGGYTLESLDKTRRMLELREIAVAEREAYAKCKETSLGRIEVYTRKLFDMRNRELLEWVCDIQDEQDRLQNAISALDLPRLKPTFAQGQIQKRYMRPADEDRVRAYQMTLETEDAGHEEISDRLSFHDKGSHEKAEMKGFFFVEKKYHEVQEDGDEQE